LSPKPDTKERIEKGRKLHFCEDFLCPSCPYPPSPSFCLRRKMGKIARDKKREIVDSSKLRITLKTTYIKPICDE